MATVLSNQKSTYGNPYAFWTLEMTVSNRTANSITVNWTVRGHLEYDISSLGTGYPLNVVVYAGGNSQTKAIKASSESWSGTSEHSVSGSFTVSGLSETTTSIATALAITSSVDTSCTLSKTSGSNITIPSFTAIVIPDATPLNDTTVVIPFVYADGEYKVVIPFVYADGYKVSNPHIN